MVAIILKRCKYMFGLYVINKDLKRTYVDGTWRNTAEQVQKDYQEKIKSNENGIKYEINKMIQDNLPVEDIENKIKYQKKELEGEHYELARRTIASWSPWKRKIYDDLVRLTT
jgi:hypothetical protein